MLKLSKMKFLPAVVSVAILIASAAIVRTIHSHKAAAPADQSMRTNAVFGSDGRLIGVAPDQSTREEMKALLDSN
jgi:hypothetical protein